MLDLFLWQSIFWRIDFEVSGLDRSEESILLKKSPIPGWKVPISHARRRARVPHGFRNNCRPRRDCARAQSAWPMHTRRAFIALHLSRCAYCARVGGGPSRDRTPYLHFWRAIVFARMHYDRTGAEVVGATLLSSLSHVCASDPCCYALESSPADLRSGGFIRRYLQVRRNQFGLCIGRGAIMDRARHISHI